MEAPIRRLPVSTNTVSACNFMCICICTCTYLWVFVCDGYYLQTTVPACLQAAHLHSLIRSASLSFHIKIQIVFHPIPCKLTRSLPVERWLSVLDMINIISKMINWKMPWELNCFLVLRQQHALLADSPPPVIGGRNVIILQYDKITSSKDKVDKIYGLS